MNEYNRNYGSLEEFKKREKIFRENKIKINQKNKAKKKELYELGITAFADFSPEEFK